ncbi:class I SAM-dependent methyltransferase [Oceanobacter sp. 3_MG-2023]|uniref:class I SAM-dependent methyltransferase n=1 Tax=Oceanobacter sp. 3_MG-2023 TaxID=3062622 RepID=UPI00273481B2|nr:class I SAM-dependent methyltransferase [Oceanobacter sp. 3_MG-2023]MDP2506785.1 class I SAM-dependent methyltransferase [Oceanobacter sp. 3_MG-2023]
MAELICLAPEYAAEAAVWSERYGLTAATVERLQQPGFHLCLGGDGLSLREGAGGKAVVRVDFAAGATAHRRRFGGGLGQDIAKAVGVSGAYQPSVIDATAGLGRDSFVLATLGCQVVAHERQPVVAALLDDGLIRGRQDVEAGEIVRRIRFSFGSSHTLLIPEAEMARRPDVVYLDPMFGEDAKGSAQVKKDMQAFRLLVGGDADADELLDAALQAARCRVVVKRGRKAAPLANRAPSYALTGKSNRFDVYVLAKVAPLAE